MEKYLSSRVIDDDDVVAALKKAIKLWEYLAKWPIIILCLSGITKTAHSVMLYGRCVIQIQSRRDTSGVGM